MIRVVLCEQDMIGINKEVNGPTFASMVEGGKTSRFTAKQLQNMGFNTVAYGRSMVCAASRATRALARELIDTGTTTGFADRMITFNDFNSLVGPEEIRSLEDMFYRDVADSADFKGKGI